MCFKKITSGGGLTIKMKNGKKPTLRRCNTKTRNANQKLFGMFQYFLIALPAHA